MNVCGLCNYANHSTKLESTTATKASMKSLRALHISSEEWKQLFILPMNCTCERKLHEFQYKLLHNCLTLNPYLFKIGIQTKIEHMQFQAEYIPY